MQQMAAPLAPHHGPHRLRAQERAFEIDIEHAVPRRLVQPPEQLIRHHARVVYERVDAPPGRLNGGRHFRDGGRGFHRQGIRFQAGMSHRQRLPMASGRHAPAVRQKGGHQPLP